MKIVHVELLYLKVYQFTLILFVRSTLAATDFTTLQALNNVPRLPFRKNAMLAGHLIR